MELPLFGGQLTAWDSNGSFEPPVPSHVEIALGGADEDSVEEIDELSGRTQQKAAVHGLLRDLYQRAWRYPAGIVAHSSRIDAKQGWLLARNA